MKKNLVAFIGFVMLAFSMTACDSKEKAGASDNEEKADSVSVSDSVANAKDVVYSTDDYSITYNTKNFKQLDVRGNIQFSYCNEEVKAPGSNVIIITKEEGTTVADVMGNIVKTRGMTESDVTDVTVGEQAIPGKSITSKSESPAGNDLNLHDTVILVQSGSDVISLELIRTVGSDEETEMTIEGAFTSTFESFKLNK